MTEADVKQVHGMVAALWPFTSRWTGKEWEVLLTKAEHIPISLEQAQAALENLKGTSEKSPNVATMLNALRRCLPTKTASQQAKRDEPVSVLAQYRTRLACSGITLANDAHPSEVVAAYWRDTFRVSMRIRGTVPDDHQRACVADLIELGRCPQADADEWCYSLVQEVSQVPILLDLAKRRGKTSREIERMAKSMEATA